MDSNNKTANNINVATEEQGKKKEEKKQNNNPLSIRADPETKAKFYQIVNESFGDDKDAVKNAMKMIVDSYELSHLATLVPTVAMQTENLNSALDSISNSYIQTVQSMEDYKNILRKNAEEDVAEANAQRDRMAEELKKAQEAERTAIEERDKAISDRDQAQDVAQAKTDLAENLQAQNDQLNKTIEELRSSGSEQESIRQDIRSIAEYLKSTKDEKE